jgi:hypothetical protein
MWDDNIDKTAALEARACIKNHQRKAVNFTSTEADGTVKDSPLKAIIGEGWKADGDKPKAAETAKPTGIAPSAPAPDSDDFDDDVPF